MKTLTLFNNVGDTIFSDGGITVLMFFTLLAEYIFLDSQLVVSVIARKILGNSNDSKYFCYYCCVIEIQHHGLLLFFCSYDTCVMKMRMREVLAMSFCRRQKKHTQDGGVIVSKKFGLVSSVSVHMWPRFFISYITETVWQF